MRSYLVLMHRCIGLFIAGFLLLSALTGAVLSWQEELEAWLNPQWYQLEPTAPRPALDLVQQYEQEHPQVRVTALPLQVKNDQALKMWVQARHPHTPIGFNQVFIHPQTAQQLGARQWGQMRLDAEHLLPLVYKFHYSLLIPGQWGIWLLGAVAVLWFCDCFIALAIAFPNLAQWRKSVGFRLSRGKPKAVFDLHRSGGVWLWLLLLPFACTAVSMNLNRELMRPLVGFLSPLAPSPYDRPVTTSAIYLERAQLLQRAQDWAQQEGLIASPISFSCVYSLNLCSVELRAEGQFANPLHTTKIFLDASQGAITTIEHLGKGSRGDIFLKLQHPLHSGQIAGSSGRVLVTLLGLSLAVLSLTGVMIFYRKYAARRS